MIHPGFRVLMPYFDAELAGRGDAGLWTWAASTPEGCRVLEIGAGTPRLRKKTP